MAYHYLTAATGITLRQTMVLPAASALTPSSNFPVASTKSRVSQPHNSFLINVRKQHVSVRCFAKFLGMGHFNEPPKLIGFSNYTKNKVSVRCSAKFPGMEHFNEPTKLIVFLNHTKNKVWESIPGSVKQFPWQKAESVALQKLLVLAKKTLKWSLLAWFTFSCLSDIIYSISKNKELVIPFGLFVGSLSTRYLDEISQELGLFVGSLSTRYLDEISQELMHDDKDGGITRRLLGISCFFVLVKVMSAYLLQGNDFLLHVANGGLMQVLWNWKELQKLDGEKSLSEKTIIHNPKKI